MSRNADQHGPLVDLGDERPMVSARARNSSPIVPRASIAGRALVAVVAIMTYLASLTTGAVLLVSASAAEWQSDVASEITIQVRPQAGRDIERDTAAAVTAMRIQSGIVDVRPFTKEESGKLLEPWLGSGLSLDELPVPRVIVARLAPGTALDLAALRARIAQVAPTPSVDDHLGVVCDPRRDGGVLADRRGAPFRRRRRPLHRRPLLPPLPAAWAGG